MFCMRVLAYHKQIRITCQVSAVRFHKTLKLLPVPLIYTLIQLWICIFP
jgi:hypothetical protein